MRRSISGVVSLIGAGIALLALPVASSGQGLVDQLVRDVTKTVQSLPQALQPRKQAPPRSAPSVQRRGPTPGSPGGYTPPLHGTNPHGQGTVAAVDLSPSGQRPLAGDPTGAGDQPQNREEVVVGRARGEKDANGYHGHITIISLLGNELLGVDTRPGQTGKGPVESVQTVLNSICTGTQICLTALKANSTTTGNSSTNSFAVATASVGGPGGVTAGAAESNGNISEDSNCQVSHGDSRVANATIGGAQAATVGPTSSDSRACRDGTRTQKNESKVIGLGGQNVPIPAAGCGNGTPDTVTGIPTIAPIVCNADDTTGQAADTYGVREALAVFALDTGNTALLRTAAAGAESLAKAPSGPAGPGGPDASGPGDDDDAGVRDRNRDKDGDGEGGRRGAGGAADAGAPECSDGIDNDGDGKIDFPNDPQCESRLDDSEAGKALAFTGADLLVTLLLGLLTLAAGLRLREAVGRTEF